MNDRYRAQQPGITRERKVYGLGKFSWELKKVGSYIHLVLSNGLIMFKIFQIINRLKLAAEYMVSKTGKTQVANNIMGTYMAI